MKHHLHKSLITALTAIYLTLFCYGETPSETVTIPLIGDTAPSFKAISTRGTINFPEDYWDTWVILFSHPADFTPVCTTELMSFADLEYKFKELKCELIGLSEDGLNSHISWIKDIKEIKYKNKENANIDFPVIADFDMAVAKKFGMIQKNASNTKAVRAVFIIDRKHKIRTIFYYPESVGRNVQEILRTLIALQVNDQYTLSTPANWEPGDDVVIPTHQKKEDAISFFHSQNEDYYCPTWFFCLKKLPLEKVVKP